MKLSGLLFPSNGTKVYQEDWVQEQESKENEIINRDTDVFDAGVLKGGEIATNSNPNSINFTEITIAYDSEGKRIFIPVLTNFSLPANSTFTLVLRHKFVDQIVTNPDGGSVTYKVNSYEILTRTGSIQPGDVPIRLITTASGVVTIGDDLRVWRRVKTDRIANDSITNDKQNSTVKTGLLSTITSSILSEITGDLSFAKVINQFYTIFSRDKKELGEIFWLNEIKSSSATFPALCLAQNDARIWKTSNPGGGGNIPGLFPLLVDYLRGIPLRFDPLNANNTDFTVVDWSHSGTTITLTFAYTTPKGTKESKIIRALHEDAFVHNSNDTIGVDYSTFENILSWRTITLVEPLRDDTDSIQVPIGTYQITSIAGGESGPAQIKFVHSATPSGTPKSENRIVRFYPHRIQDSGQNADSNSVIKALHFAIQGRGFVTVMDTDSEWIGGLRRRDRLQGHYAQLATYDGTSFGSTNYIAGVAPVGIGNSVNIILSTDGLNGQPRLSKTTDSRGLGLYPYIWAKSYI